MCPTRVYVCVCVLLLLLLLQVVVSNRVYKNVSDFSKLKQPQPYLLKKDIEIKTKMN